MTEERAFQLIESNAEPALNQTPNYLRLVQAYRSYIDHGASADECALRLKEITHPALRRYNLPEPVQLTAQAQHQSERLNSLLMEMVQSLSTGDKSALAHNFQLATRCFQEMG